MHINHNSLCFVGSEKSLNLIQLQNFATQFVEARRVIEFYFFDGFGNKHWFDAVSKVRKTHKRIVRIFVDDKTSRSENWLQNFLFKNFEARVVAEDSENNQNGIVLNCCVKFAIEHSTFCLFQNNVVAPETLEFAKLLHKEIVFVQN